jgi:NAD(P)-dependent dehydrogenase (short-subunit alcohol dehydrogenase family)
VTRRLVVTGASTGFGRAIARAARARGWSVLGTVRKDADAAALEAEGVATVRLDLGVPDTIGPAADAIAAWCGGRLDALVNNAGSTWPGPIELLSMDDLRQQFEVNVFGHVDLTQRLLPALRAARGRCLFVSSDSTTVTPPMVGAYAASKRAIEAIAESLAQEVADQGVTVIVVAPGPYQTAIWGTSTPRGEAYLDGDDPRLALYRPLAERVAKVSTGRPLGDPADLAAVVLDALHARRPAFRYVAPLSSRARGWVKLVVGERVFHRLVRRAIDLGAR